jgi:phage-related protein
MQMVLVKLTTPIKNFIDKLTEFVKKFTDAEAPVKKLGEGVQKIEPQIMAMAEKFEMLLPVIASVGAALATFAGKQLFSMVPVLGSVLSKLSPLPVALLVLALTSTQVRTAIGNLLNALKPILPIFTNLGKIMGTVSVVGVAVLAKAINALASIVRGSITFVQTYAGVFKFMIGVMVVLAAMYGAYMAQVLILNAYTAIQTALTTAQTGATTALGIAQAKLNMIYAMNPIGVYIALIIGLLTAFGILMATNEKFASVVGKVFNFVMKVIVQAFAWIVKGIGYILQGFAMWIRVLGFFAEVIAKVFEFIIDVVLSYYQFQLKVIKFVVDAFVNLMESHGILYDVVKTIFNAIIKVITLVISGILNIFGNLVGGVADLLGVFNKLFTGVKSVFLGIVDAIANVGEGVFKVLENVAKGIGKFLGDVFDSVTGWVRTLLNLFSKVPKIGPMVAEALGGGLDATRSAITGIANLGVDLGKGLFDKVVAGVKGTVNAIGTIGTATESGLRKVESTLKNFAITVKQFGDKDNGAKIIDVMVAGAKMASSALGTMIDAIQDVKDFDFARTVGNFIDGIANKVDEAGTFLIGLSASMMEFAENTDFAAAVGDGIGNFINKIKDSLKEGLGFGDILAEEKKKYNEASNQNDDGTKAAEDAAKAADRMKAVREAMQAGIDSIKGVLDDLRKASGEFADSLKETIMGFGGLKSIELPDGFIPKAKSLIENMRTRLDKANQFASQIAMLQGQGLDAGALKDIIEAGPIKGAQLAASILGGGKEAIDQINSLQKAISFSGAAIGQYGADAAFGGLISNAQTQLARVTEAELSTRMSGNNQFIEQGAFQVVVNTSGAKNTEEEIKMITDKIEQTFAILAKELAAK